MLFGYEVRGRLSYAHKCEIGCVSWMFKVGGGLR